MSSDMNEQDSLRAFCDALRKSASCAREMAALLEDPNWKTTADLLDHMRRNGVELAKMKAMSRMEVSHAIGLKTAKPFTGI